MHLIIPFFLFLHMYIFKHTLVSNQNVHFNCTKHFLMSWLQTDCDVLMDLQ